MYAARYTNDWRRDRRRGHSYAEWGYSAAATRAECEADWPNSECRYSRELGGWLPALPGLSAAGTGETPEDAVAAAETRSYGDYPYSYLVVFPARHAGWGSDGEECVRPVGRARVIRRPAQ